MGFLLGASASSLTLGPWQQPQGPLRIDWSRAPRGLTTCFVNNSPVFANLVNGQAATTSNAFLTATARGIAFDPSQGTGNRYVYTPAPLNPSVCSLEALLVYTSGDTGGVLATAEGTPTAGTHDRDLFFETGKFNFYIFDGAAKIVTGSTTLVAGTVYHVVAVSDGTNILIYVNGVLDGTLAAGHAFGGYTSPIFVQGYSTEAPGTQGKSPIILANFSTAAWTADEVKERYLNTFGFLVPAEGEMPALFVLSSGAPVLGWMQSRGDVLPRPSPLRLSDQPPAIALTPTTLPAPIAGMAWFAPPDRDAPRRAPSIDTVAPFTLAPIAAPPTGWGHGDDVLPARRLAPSDFPALVLTTATLPAPIAGMAWFQRWDDAPRKRAPVDQPSAVQKPAAGVPISGMAWFTPPDRDKPLARPIVEQPPAVTLIPATLPVAVSGLSWFVRWQELPGRKPPLDQPIQVQLQTAAVAAVPNGWFVQAQELLRRAFVPESVGAFAFAPPPFTGLGWFVRWPDAVPVRAAPGERPSFVSPPAPPAIAALGWQRRDDVLPVRRPLFEGAPALVLTPATLPAKISGMAWFTPPDHLPRKWKPLFDLPAWEPQFIAARFLVSNPRYVIGYDHTPVRGLDYPRPPDRGLGYPTTLGRNLP